LVRVNPTICFPFIKSFLSAVRRAALVKRDAFLAPVNPQTGEIAIFEQTVANYGERDLQTGSQVLYRKENIMKTLTTWNPLREMEEFQNRFQTFFGGLPTFPLRFPKNGDRFKMPDWSPLVDIIEDDHEYLFKADLPEMRKEDVKVTIENGVLYISGERKTEKEEKKRKFHRLERFFGTFERTFTVPEDADTTKIVAEFHDGVLQVHLPKRPMPKPQAIEVKVQ
jgi:HSP20 family protein